MNSKKVDLTKYNCKKHIRNISIKIKIKKAIRSIMAKNTKMVNMIIMKI